MKNLLQRLGPGLVTGAADDDPSGIATYTQAGAQYGTGLLWTTVLTTPLMVAIQLISARIGWVTGKGLAAALREALPRWVALTLVWALLVANVFNLGADLAAMAAAAQLAFGNMPGRWFGDISFHAYLLGFALLSLGLQIGLPFPRYAPLLKFLTLSLLAYVGVLGTVHVPWRDVIVGAVLPTLRWDGATLQMVVAVLGTTISPYLFFWQASQEAEEQKLHRTQVTTPEPLEMQLHEAQQHLRRISLDTWAGMIFSNAIAFVIMLVAAVTLHANGITQVDTTAQAAAALRPLAGDRAALLYCLGVVGTGLLAVPILAGSAAFAVAEVFRWRASLSDTLAQARGFYGVLIAAVGVGVLLNFNDTDPVRELLWSALINGIIAVPIMAALMYVATRRATMGYLAIGPRLRAAGWIATAAMGVCAVSFVFM